MKDYFKHIGKHMEWWQITSRGCFRDIEGLPVKVTSELRPEKREKRQTQNCCCSVINSCLTLRPHGLQHAGLLCLSSPWVCSNSSPLCQWWPATISSSVMPFSSCLQTFWASGSFPVSQFFTSGSQILEFPLQHQSFQWIFRFDFF